VIKIHPVLKEIASIYNDSGKQLYLVGGAVRDMLMGKEIHDWDLATDALPEETREIIKKAKGKVIPTGIKHGTVTVFYKRYSAEVTTFRLEAGYSDGRRPDSVRFSSKIEEDLSRRDFTMNAIAMRLPKGEIVDPFGGEADIKKKIIRCVGNAPERFGEDGLRPLRAVRFASRLGFEIEQSTYDAIQGALPVCAKVSWERARDEIEKILDSAVPSRGFLLMEKTGLLKLFLEELYSCRGVEQKGFHEFDVMDHCLYACDFAAAKGYSKELRYAALFHDIGKPQTRAKDELGIWTFYRHEEVSANLAQTILERLRCSNAIIERVCHLVREHMFNYTDNWSDAAVRRFIARAGEANLDDFYSLRLADVYALSRKEHYPVSLLDLEKRVKKVIEEGNALSLKNLAVSGKDLMEEGIPSGKVMGNILKELLETVLDDPEQNNKETLLKIALNLYKS
jgi:putative nucleotidyltransferase with HDIG domain